jgi:hypothetical protein
MLLPSTRLHQQLIQLECLLNLFNSCSSRITFLLLSKVIHRTMEEFCHDALGQTIDGLPILFRQVSELFLCFRQFFKTKILSFFLKAVYGWDRTQRLLPQTEFPQFIPQDDLRLNHFLASLSCVSFHDQLQIIYVVAKHTCVCTERNTILEHQNVCEHTDRPGTSEQSGWTFRGTEMSTN